MKKLIVGAVALAVAALGLGGLATTAPTANADVTSTMVVNCVFLPDPTLCPAAGGEFDTSTLTLAEVQAAADLSAAQLSSQAAGAVETAIFAMVDDDTNVTFDVPTSIGADVTCTTDEDCNDNGTAGDGMAAAAFWAADSATVGNTASIDITQAGLTPTVETVDLLIVGAPSDVSIVETEETVSTGSGCPDAADASASDASDLDKLLASAVVTDSDGNALVGVDVDWSVDASGNGEVVAIATTAASDADTNTTINTADGIAAPALVCGVGVGEVTVTADAGAAGTADATKTVVGAAANLALTAEPAAIACDGVNSSTVTAVVTDADGNPVVAGTQVQFNVVALGTASPINATTDETGTASSTITPLSVADAGVVVTVSSGSAAQQIRVDCQAAAATPTVGPAPTATPQGGIVGPGTGNGGYLGQDSSAGFPLWTLFALALGGIALTAGTAVARRVSR